MNAPCEAVAEIVTRPDAEEIRNLASSLAEALECGWCDEAERLLTLITGLHEGALYHEIGRLAREIHAALQGFAGDARLAELARSELPDAKERIRYVMERTEDAAHRTLGAIEDTQPLVRTLGERAKELAAEMSRLRRRELGPGEFRELVASLDTFLDRAVADADRIGANLNDALLAQEFQDLTGQVLRRVTNLVQELESHLVEMLRTYCAVPVRTIAAAAGPTEAEGPTTSASADRAQDQDEVDALLSDLGF